MCFILIQDGWRHDFSIKTRRARNRKNCSSSRDRYDGPIRQRSNELSGKILGERDFNDIFPPLNSN